MNIETLTQPVCRPTQPPIDDPDDGPTIEIIEDEARGAVVAVDPGDDGGARLVPVDPNRNDDANDDA